MKTYTIFALLLILLAIGASAQIAESADVQVSMINQEPDPTPPGGNVIVRFRIENLGSRPAENTQFEIIPEYPFSLATGESLSRNLGTLAGRQKDKIGVTVSFNLIVDSAASEGQKELYVRYKLADGASSRVGPFNISIKARQAVVEIKEVKVNPQTVQAGDKFNLSVSIQNNAKSMLTNLQVALDLSGTTLPFAPVTSGQLKSASQIRPDDRIAFQYSLVALPSATAGIYKIPIKLSYTDQLGTNYSRDELTSITIGGRPTITALISDQDTLKSGGTGTVTLQIINNGLVGAKLATAELLPSADYEILSGRKIYVGTLDSDDFDSVDYKLYVNSGITKTVMPFVIEYLDSNNNKYAEHINLTPRIFTGDEATKFGFEKKSQTGLLIAIVIVIVGFFAYRIFFKRKQ